MLTIQLVAQHGYCRQFRPGFVKTNLTGYGTMTPEETGSFLEPDGNTLVGL
ncbi:hypothetical protein [Pararhizobium sp. PWRC1-1]|uniref:hypothetical protein n=1 Tax=Pararhizobium sp. PWRC1-1 TaxID=2804566 RepID=UPI003CF973FA